ncbi:TadE/TadG family type IV pilus assembly protein [Altererythrobacter sp. Root672]|uniref:TadE/TadG family type IV pilus assembly protein n=1 Tax=Altererythrobacter sp. Root672 TaxID=1736584 RepID=UPI000A5D8808|nr:TadE/TadG family type IV pilus assembly protein [Altererythrobacter sp. Root672]
MIAPFAKFRRLHSYGQLRRDQRGVAFVEFALSLPLLLILMGSGLELANYVIATKQIGELAAMVSDNASRMGSQSGLRNKPISEADINDVFIGADLQAGPLDIDKNARIILSSLQRDDDGSQKIVWQRCFGEQDDASAYGVEGATIASGMGPAGAEVTAAPNTAVMVVEVVYRYQRLMPVMGLPLGEIREFAAFNIRDDRDLTEPPTLNATPSKCD